MTFGPALKRLPMPPPVITEKWQAVTLAAPSPIAGPTIAPRFGIPAFIAFATVLNVRSIGKYDHPEVLIVVTLPPPLDPSTSLMFGSLRAIESSSMYIFKYKHPSSHVSQTNIPS